MNCKDELRSSDYRFLCYTFVKNNIGNDRKNSIQALESVRKTTFIHTYGIPGRTAYHGTSKSFQKSDIHGCIVYFAYRIVRML